jgi:outer membrane protein assembly factor BamB
MISLAVVLATLGLAGCWPQVGGDPGNTYHQPLARLTVAQVQAAVPLATVDGTPAAVMGGTFVTYGPSPGADPTAPRLDVVARDPATGVERWRRDMLPAGLVPTVPPQAPVIAGDEVWFSWFGGSYETGCQAGLERHDLATGDRVGRGPVDVVATRLVPFEDRVALVRTEIGRGCNGLGSELAVVDAETGAAVWHGPAGSLPVVDRGRLFIATHDDTVEAFPAQGCGTTECEPTWSVPAVSASGEAVLNAVRGRVAVLAPTADYTASTLVVRDGATGAELWRTDVPSRTARMATDGDVIYVALPDEVRAYPAAGCGAAACAPTWTATVTQAATPPVVAGDVVLVGSPDGVVVLDRDGCAGPPCAPVATLPVATGVTDLIVAGRRIYAGSYYGTTIFGSPADAADAAAADTAADTAEAGR